MLSSPRTRRPGPASTTVVSEAYRLTPEGKEFLAPVELTIPIVPASLPAGKTVDDVIVVRAPQGSSADSFVPIPTRREGNAVVASTEHFSDFYAVVVDDGAAPFGSCGDAMCLATESCDACPFDCGLCLPSTDATPPSVVALLSPSTMVGVGALPLISVSFSEPVFAASVGEPTFTLTDPNGDAVAGAYTVTGARVDLTLVSPLSPSLVYTLRIVGVRDLAGNTMTAAYTTSFTTASGVAFVAATPSSGATNVAQASTLVFGFDGALDPATITAQAIDGACSGSVQVSADDFTSCLGGTVVLDGTGEELTFDPVFPLRGSATIVARLASGARSTSGFPITLPANYTITIEQDLTNPFVVSSVPTNGATSVPMETTITVVFSEPINPASAVDAETLYDGEGHPPVVNTIDGNVLTIEPGWLERGWTYYLDLSSLTDLAGRPVATTDVSFRIVDPASAVVEYPIQGSRGVHPRADFVVTFDEPIDETTLTMQTSDGPCEWTGLEVHDGDDNCVGGVVVPLGGTSYAIRTTTPLGLLEGHSFEVRSVIQTPDGYPIASPEAVLFQTSPIDGWGYSVVSIGVSDAAFAVGGLATIDAACTAFDGTERKAMVITSSRRPCSGPLCGLPNNVVVDDMDWVLEPGSAYQLLDGTHYFTTNPLAPIVWDETTGIAPENPAQGSPQAFYFGGNSSWNHAGASASCNDFTVADDTASTTLGELSDATASWLATASPICSGVYQVLCVEQPPATPRPVH